MTFNILATAVATPMTGWLVAAFGRRNLMVGSMALFSRGDVSVRRGRIAGNPGDLAHRAGRAGAPVIAAVADHPARRLPEPAARLITSIYGMTVVIGPVIGPALGGYMSELYSWRWAFYMIVPVGIVSLHRSAAQPAARPAAARRRLDWIGFLSLSTAIACVQLVLSRGQRLDWFESTEISSRRSSPRSPSISSSRTA